VNVKSLDHWRLVAGPWIDGRPTNRVLTDGEDDRDGCGDARVSLGVDEHERICGRVLAMVRIPTFGDSGEYGALFKAGVVCDAEFSAGAYFYYI
jgi:hypothetical protein